MILFSAKSVLLVLSEDSLIQTTGVFIINCCVFYNIPMISVHDLTSCNFPHPSHQPQEVQDSGLFQEKATTYVKDYFDAILTMIDKQIATALKKRNVIKFLYHVIKIF